MLSLLLVEDDVSLGTELRSFFLDFFDTVTLHVNAKEALQWLENNRADVIVSDICMPEIDGLEFLRHVRKLHPEQLLIVISAHPQTDYFLESIELGIYRFFIKPFDTAKLIEEMGALIARLRRQKNDTPCVYIGSFITYNIQTQTLYINTEPCLLTKKEAQLLHLLVLNRHHFISEEAIAQAIWDDAYVSPSTVRALIRRLRARLGQEDTLENYRGFGYRLACTPLSLTEDNPKAD